MLDDNSYKKIEALVRRVVREELEELLLDKEINPKYIEKIKQIREEPHIGFNSVEELDSIVKNA